MLSTAERPRIRQPAPHAMKRIEMLTPLRSPPRIIFTNGNGDAVSRRHAGAVVFDRQAQSIQCDSVRVTLRNRRVFRLADFILSALPATDLSREKAAEVAGISGTDDFSTRIRQVRHLLRPFGIGVATAWGGRIVITDPEAASC